MLENRGGGRDKVDKKVDFKRFGLKILGPIKKRERTKEKKRKRRRNKIKKIVYSIDSCF